jgi:hypothetical protein
MLHLRIENPLTHKDWQLKSCTGFSITKNKSVDISYGRNTGVLLEITFMISRRTHHGGFTFNATLFSHALEFMFYDNRHWNHTAGRYETEDEGWEVNKVR